jgi:Uma2 family endonuclease
MTTAQAIVVSMILFVGLTLWRLGPSPGVDRGSGFRLNLASRLLHRPAPTMKLSHNDVTMAIMEQAVSPTRHYTVDEYLQLERDATEKHEYRDGQIIAMAGATYTHVLIVTNLIQSLANRLDGTGCRPLANDLRVRAQRSASYAYPDVAVVCGEPEFDPTDESGMTVTNPRVVIEVLSPSTELTDRTEKFARYIRMESLEEYVLIAQDKPRVESYYRQPDGTWSFAYAEGLETVVRIRSLKLDLPLREIYKNAKFAISRVETP